MDLEALQNCLWYQYTSPEFREFIFSHSKTFDNRGASLWNKIIQAVELYNMENLKKTNFSLAMDHFFSKI